VLNHAAQSQRRQRVYEPFDVIRIGQ
jgi:hypothetical protein